jgi:hypothetical protein
VTAWRALWLLPALLVAAALPAQADSPIAVTEIWAPPALKGAPTAAAYFTLVNRGSDADRLVGLASPAATRAELHQESIANGIMRMRPLPGLDLPPGKPVSLVPGHAHVMLIGLKQPLQAGDSFSLTLTFAKAAPLTVSGKVEPRATGAVPMTGPGMDRAVDK